MKDTQFSFQSIGFLVGELPTRNVARVLWSISHSGVPMAPIPEPDVQMPAGNEKKGAKLFKAKCAQSRLLGGVADSLQEYFFTKPTNIESMVGQSCVCESKVEHTLKLPNDALKPSDILGLKQELGERARGRTDGRHPQLTRRKAGEWGRR